MPGWLAAEQGERVDFYSGPVAGIPGWSRAPGGPVLNCCRPGRDPLLPPWISERGVGHRSSDSRRKVGLGSWAFHGERPRTKLGSSRAPSIVQSKLKDSAE